MLRHTSVTVVTLLAGALLLPGCQTGKGSRGPSPRDQQGTSRDKNTEEKGVTVEDDPSKSRIRFVSPNVHHGKAAGNVYLVRSWLDRKTGVVTHQIYVTDRYLTPNPRNWNQAAGPKGDRLKFTKIDSKVENCNPDGCPRMEAFGAGIDDAALRAAASRGYTITFTAEDGTKEAITVTPEQISDQIQAIDTRRASMPAAKDVVKKPAPPKKPVVKKTPSPTAPMNSGY